MQHIRAGLHNPSPCCSSSAIIRSLSCRFLNMAWACACYIIVSVGTAIYTRRTLQATYVCWPDWCFWLAFFSGVFWIIAGLVALSGELARLCSCPYMGCMHVRYLVCFFLLDIAHSQLSVFTAVRLCQALAVVLCM